MLKHRPMVNPKVIPKIIHYVWVGNAPKSELALRCIASWKKFLPDYEIIEWNNERFSALNNRYAQEAFAAKKWAFVSDYLRLYALHQFGGFYFDTDLELTADLEQFRHHGFVIGFENFKGRIAPLSAMIGAAPGHLVIEKLLSAYENKSFYKADGSEDLTPNTGLFGEVFGRTFGLHKPYRSNQTCQLTDDAFVYPSHYFCTPEAGKENFSIHHFSGSWFEEYSRKLLVYLAGYQLLRLKRNKVRSGELPLKAGERKIALLELSSRYSLLLLKSAV
jgi:hypothetical protein